jgi:hypothetical protein
VDQLFDLFNLAGAITPAMVKVVNRVVFMFVSVIFIAI